MINIDHLSFTYPGASHPALKDVCLQVADGELCLVMGPSGGGKSTLLRCINGLVPHFSGGSLTGSIRVNGLDPVRLSPREMSRMVGFVFQDPEAQFVVDRVEDEVAFALENASIPPVEMDTRIEQVLALLELIPLRRRKLGSLSGGERQRVAIAAALALRPHILILDEPTSQLDPHGAEEVLECLMQLNKNPGLTILLAEHRLERVLPFARQVFYLSEEYPGGLAGPPRDVLNRVALNPPIITLGKAFGWQPLPLTVEEAQSYVKESPGSPTVASGFQEMKAGEGVKRDTPAIIQAKGVHVYYERMHALQGVELDLRPGEITVLMGPNGSGKTTLVRSLIGLAPIQEGSVLIDGQDIAGRAVADICQQVGYLPQNPNALLFADTVLEELQITLHNHHLEPKDMRIEPGDLLERLGLTDKAGTYPRDLSTGERQRAALGAITVTGPKALLLDEPTRGLDYGAKKILLDLLQGWRNEGMAILLVTHDVELAVQAADRVIMLEAGRIIADGDPKEVLAASAVFSPQVVKIFPGRGWLTVNDAIRGANASQH